MPHAPRPPSTPADPVLSGRVIELRWAATIDAQTTPNPGGTNRARGANGANRSNIARIETRVMVITLQPVDGQHTLMEAWLETPTGRRTLMPRQPITSTISASSGYVHIDATWTERRVIALSMPYEETPSTSRVYAQSALLDDAGFAPGASHPPTATLRRVKADAVPA